MATKRQSPYIWVTWLTKLLVGENSCEWGAWFRAQHERSSWDRVPGTFDETGWQLEHTTLATQVRTRFEETGKAIFTEGQNHFTLRGTTATLGGKPDLIATGEGSGTIIDVKTGKPSPSHHVQVMVYMYAVPRALRQYRGIDFQGKVIYRDHEVDIPGSALDAPFIDNLAQLIRRLGSSQPARKVPSSPECGFCDITEVDCPERAVQGRAEEGETSDF
ncbi:MAG: PD-(D/E)XK nuclease family protein [Dehalococcoidia bacterium]